MGKGSFSTNYVYLIDRYSSIERNQARAKYPGQRGTETTDSLTSALRRIIVSPACAMIIVGERSLTIE